MFVVGVIVVMYSLFAKLLSSLVCMSGKSTAVGVQPNINKDSLGEFIVIICGNVTGQFYVRKYLLNPRKPKVK